MRYLSWDETLFKDAEVFDPEYLPDELIFRDQQLDRISSNLKPALKKSRPINMLCLGPPGTGKTSCIRLIFKEIEEIEDIIPVYVNCQLVSSNHGVFARIFERVYGYPLPSYGIPFPKLYASILKKLVELDRILIVALDDINLLLDDKIMNDAIYSILKAHEDVEGIKTGVIAIGTDLKLAAKLDGRVGSIFHPDEIFFPPYGTYEIFEILKRRCEIGFYQGVVDDEVIERVAELTYEAGDVRVGLYTLKMAGIEAERRGSRKIEVDDVLKSFEGSRKVFLRKCMVMLNETEKELLKIIYSLDELTTGELYEKFTERRSMSYTKFYNLLTKLENLRTIDLVFKSLKKGRTRVIMKRFEPEVVLDALKEF
jgi:cell division control protein 6